MYVEIKKGTDHLHGYSAIDRVGKMSAFMSKVHATGIYWHILAFPKSNS